MPVASIATRMGRDQHKDNPDTRPKGETPWHSQPSQDFSA